MAFDIALNGFEVSFEDLVYRLSFFRGEDELEIAAVLFEDVEPVGVVFVPVVSADVTPVGAFKVVADDTVFHDVDFAEEGDEAECC